MDVADDEKISPTSCICISHGCKLIQSQHYSCALESKCSCYFDKTRYTPEYCHCPKENCIKSLAMLFCRSASGACKCIT